MIFYRLRMACAMATVAASMTIVAELRAQVYLSGSVMAAPSKEEIAGASIAILGTSKGAMANRDGQYRLKLDANKAYRLRITAIGFRPDTIMVSIAHDEIRNIQLLVAPLRGEIVISADASRNEARRIMHKVIDGKDAWQNAINDYRFDVYARLNVRTQNDTSSKVIAVLESVADGFWKRDKGYAEKITARKQTANLPSAVNQIALLDIDNFYNDRIQLGDYDIVGPAAHDAFDRYDYDLVKRGELNGSPVFKIAVEPRSAINPAFTGTLWIDQNDYTIVYLNLSPNEAIKLGPIKDIHLEQTFGFVDNKYWMPSQLGSNATFKLDLPIIPAIHMEQNAVLQNYSINRGIPDSVFQNKRHQVAGTADSTDSTDWLAMRAIPLIAEEGAAYHRFDSLAKIPPTPKTFSPLGLLFEVVPIPDFYAFNRVEGSRFMINPSISQIGNWPLSIGSMIAYGMADDRWKYSLSLTQGLRWKKRTSLSAEFAGGDITFGGQKDVLDVISSINVRLFDYYQSRGTAYDPIVNTITTLLLHNDYPDYFCAKGFELSIEDHSSALSVSAFLKHEQDFSLPKRTDYSLLNRNDTFRVNPLIREAAIDRIGLDFSRPFASGHWTLGLSLHAEIGNQRIPTYQPDVYSTTTLHLELDGKLGGWGRTHFEGTLNRLLFGRLLEQQSFYFEARNAIFAPQGVFHTMYPMEFQGDRTWSAMFEQNFYDLPIRLMGIKLPEELNWIGFVNAAYAAIGPKTSANLISNFTIVTHPNPNQIDFPPTYTAQPIQGTGTTPFLEAGIGIANILNVIRIDAAWRLTHRVEHNFFVTGTLAFNF